MPSRAKPGAARERAEFALRILALGALVLSVLQVAGTFSGDEADNSSAPVVFTSSAAATSTHKPLLTSLRRILSSTKANESLHVLANSIPLDSTRALLSAASAAGVPVRWTDSSSRSAIAVEATSIIDPKGGVSMRASAPAGTHLAFRDSLGVIDTVTSRGTGASLTIGRLAGSVQVIANGNVARSVAPLRPVIRRVLLIANPEWEAKFTAAALEERGWTVDVRYALGKNVAVTQGQPVVADTARYAAVIALDSSAVTHAGELRRYAQSGGGVVIAGGAGTLRELGDLLPGHEGALVPGVPGGLATDTPLNGISRRPIAPDTDAIVLARGTIVARRYGAGRVVQLAYGEVWQWRMAGPDGAVEAHRQWWSDIVSLVAFAPAAPTSAAAITALPGSAAPLADMVARFGPAGAMPTIRAREGAGTSWEFWLLATAVVALLLEWASRRLRGAR